MRASIDSMGRVVIPKAMRDELGLTAGADIDISRFGGGVHIEPGGRSARLEREGEHLVIVGDAVLTDDQMYALIDEGRR